MTPSAKAFRHDHGNDHGNHHGATDMTRSAKRLQQRQPSAAENVLNMATAAGIALKAENGRLEAIASRPPSEVMRRLLERHEAAILALLRGQS